MAAETTIERFRRLVAEGTIIIDDGHMSHEVAKIEDPRSTPERKILWTDASSQIPPPPRDINTPPTVGFAVVWMQEFDEGLHQFLGDKQEQEWADFAAVSTAADIHRGEAHAVFAALTKGEELFEPGKVGTIVVYSDGGVGAFFSAEIKDPASFTRKATVRAVELADRGFEVEIRNCKAHAGLHGNELADFFSRRAAGLGPRLDEWGQWARGVVDARDKRRRDLGQLHEEEMRAAERDLLS